MTDAPKIGGRFEFDPSTQTLEVWFYSGTHEVLGPEADFNKTLRGEVPIKVTGGSVTAKSKLTWSEQLAGKMDAEADRLLKGARVNRYSPKGRLQLSLADLNLGALLADILPKEPSNEPQSSSSDSDPEPNNYPPETGAE